MVSETLIGASKKTKRKISVRTFFKLSGLLTLQLPTILLQTH